MKDVGNFEAGFDKSHAGKNLYFRIFKHCMGSILIKGIAYHVIFKASGFIFVVVIDYFCPTICAAAPLAEIGRGFYILTHDSI